MKEAEAIGEVAFVAAVVPALRRIEIVAALADSAYIAHGAGGSKTDLIVKKLKNWKAPIL